MAIIFCSWEADKVIEYIKSENLKQRSYEGQEPMHNETFNGMLRDIAAKVKAGELKDGNEP